MDNEYWYEGDGEKVCLPSDRIFGIGQVLSLDRNETFSIIGHRLGTETRNTCKHRNVKVTVRANMWRMLESNGLWLEWTLTSCTK